MSIDRIGVIGTGAIAEAIIDGLSAVHGDRMAFFVSPRNARMAGVLAERHTSVTVCTDNQGVVDSASVILLAVRPDVAEQVLTALTVGPQKLLISAVAGWSIARLRRSLPDDVEVVRAIPLPSLRHSRGTTALYPGNPTAQRLFESVGTTVVAQTAEQFDALSAATSSISTLVRYSAAVSRWLVDQGLDSDDADSYVLGIYSGALGSMSATGTDLTIAAASHETPGGINEGFRSQWLTAADEERLESALDRVYTRVTRGSMER